MLMVSVSSVVFSAHAEVVPMHVDGFRVVRGILRARGGSSIPGAGVAI